MLLKDFSAAQRRQAAIRTRDAMLTVPTPAESEAYFNSRATNQEGRTWTGDPAADARAVLASVDAETDPKLREATVKEALEAYQLGGSSTWTVTAAGTAHTDRALSHLSADGRTGVARARQMNAAAREFWNRR